MRARLLPAALLLIAATPMTDPPIRPGLWETNSTVTNLQIPGLPGFLARMMTKPKSEQHCITPEQAAKGPIDSLSKRKDCTVQNYVLTKDSFDFATVCPEKEGARSTMHIQGRFSPAAYTATGTIQGTGGKKGDIRIDFTGSGKRLGDCAAGKP